MPDVVNPDTHHEKSDVNARALLWFFVIFVIFAVITHVVLYLQFRYFQSLFRGATNAPLTAIARPADASVPPEPRLQPFATRGAPYVETPASDMERMRAAEEQALSSPGWIDKEKGVVRIPIDVAKRLAIQRLNTPRPQP